MDMFVYGCPRVLRYLSLLNHTAVLYEQKGILDNLGITQKELREICVISGTDYNMSNTSSNNSKMNPTLYNTLKLFKKFKKKKVSTDFYDWLLEETNYIEDYELLQKINDIFKLTNAPDNFEQIKIINGQIMYSDMKEILKTDGFIFPEN